MDRFRIGFLLYPHMTQLDVTGPAQFLANMSGAELYFVWKDREPVLTDAGFSILPTATFGDCPQMDMICTPGGGGQAAAMQDPQVIDWLKGQGATAKYITSVCSGSLLLGAAGLITGYRTGAHWAYREYLSRFGATAEAQRVVKDRNRITGGGVTAGVDFALAVIEEIRGAEEAKAIQLLLEYDPAPPYDCGTPDRATPETIAAAKALLATLVARAAQDGS